MASGIGMGCSWRPCRRDAVANSRPGRRSAAAWRTATSEMAYASETARSARHGRAPVECRARCIRLDPASVSERWLQTPMLLLGGWWDPHLRGLLTSQNAPAPSEANRICASAQPPISSGGRKAAGCC